MAQPGSTKPNTSAGSSYTVSEIEVSEAGSDISPAAADAAMLYANGRSQEAIDTLVQACKTNMSHQHTLDAWFMLLDLFQAEGKKTEFDKVSMEFVIRFERSPPAWREEGQQEDAAPKAKAASTPSVTLTGELSEKCRTQLDDALAKTPKDGTLRLDLGKLTKVLPTGCQALLAFLQKQRKSDSQLNLKGAETLQKLLEQSVRSFPKEEAPHIWLLLLELCQLQGLEEAFDKISVGYAITFEVSPPCWEAPPKHAAVQTNTEASAEGAEEPATPASEDTFSLSGVITGGNEPQLAKLASFAATRQQTAVDMSQLKRIDFIGAGTLHNIFSGLRRNNKEVVVLSANAMIIALFSVVGMTELVTIVRDKQH